MHRNRAEALPTVDQEASKGLLLANWDLTAVLDTINPYPRK
jgi:hypothetical protein